MKPFNNSNFIKKALQITILAGVLSASSFVAASTFATTGASSLAVAQQGNSGITKPKNGQDKISVENSYGTPLEKIASVGEPPISKWVYQEFTVYFEHDLVLHAVLHK